jgi:hypothetical protein
MSEEDNSKPMDELVEIKVPVYIINKVEIFLLSSTAKELGLNSVDRAIPHILLDWLNKIPGLSKVDNHS